MITITYDEMQELHRLLEVAEKSAVISPAFYIKNYTNDDFMEWVVLARCESSDYFLLIRKR